MIHTVMPNESLWTIALRYFGDGQQWRKIATDNRLTEPDLIFVGQQLKIEGAVGDTGRPVASEAAGQGGSHANSLIFGQNYVFVLADEVNPFRQKAVRRVLVNPRMAAEAGQALGRPLHIFPNPERFGFHPTSPDSPLSVGRHALGMKPSPFQSASTRLFGATRFTGTPFWIDVEAAGRAGATFHTTEEILVDLDRIAAKTRGLDQIERINQVKQLVRADGEVLARGNIAPSAIKGPASMALTRSLQGVQIIGFTMTAVNMTQAAQQSVRTNSVRPVAAER